MVCSNTNDIGPFFVDIRKGCRKQEPPLYVSPWRTVKVNRNRGGNYRYDEDILYFFSRTGNGSQDIDLSVYTNLEDADDRAQLKATTGEREHWIYVYTNPDLPQKKKKT